MFFYGKETYILLVSTPNEATFILIVLYNRLHYNVFTKYLYKEVIIMASTQPVNFRVDSTFYQQTKEILVDEKITLSDVFNSVEDLKKEILLGHQDINQGKLTSLSDVRKEFGLD